MKAVASAGHEVIWPRLCYLVHISPTTSYVAHEALAVAVLEACLIHLQNAVIPLVKHKIYQKKKSPNQFN